MENKELSISLITIPQLNNKNFSKSNSFMTKFYQDLDINEVKIINSLLYTFNSYMNKHQKEERILEHFKNIIFKNGFFRIPLKDILNLINSNRNLTLQDVENHLTNIKNKSFRVKTLKEKENKQYVVNITTSFILKFKTYTPKDLFNENIQKLSYLEIYIDEELYQHIFELNSLNKIGGYTKNLNIEMNKLSSRLGYGLYEELIRILPLKKLDNKRKTKDYIEDFTYNLNDLNEIFGTNYKYIAHLKSKIETQYKKLLKLELIEDIYSFSYGRNILNISVNRTKMKLEEILF